MQILREAENRGVANLGWLESHHTFSFGNYYDPAHMGFGPLRVINDDRVQPGQGFGEHPHRDMEIITYVLDGALEHRDSMGNGSVIRPGDVQRMSAGTGIRHSEFNHSATEPVHFLQIWILPATHGIPPSYEQLHFAAAERRNRLRLVGSPDGADGSLTIHQDVKLFAALLDPEHRVTHQLAAGRSAWVHVARGTLLLNGQVLHAGDGVAVTAEQSLELIASEAAELLLFDMAHN